MSIGDIIKLNKGKLSYLDLEILIAHSLGKTREFVLAHPEHAVTKKQGAEIKKLIERRIKKEPIAYIIGHKEFYGLGFIVNRHTLIPRPETELITEYAIKEIRSKKQRVIIADIGTGSGNIIISIAYSLKRSLPNPYNYYGIDISENALKVARKNARNHGVNKKIIFLKGNLLDPLSKINGFKKINENSLVITANLPYLSKKIYSSAPVDVKKYEPKSALYSPKEGLQHYGKLLLQLKNFITNLQLTSVICLFEISPEQKQTFNKIIKTVFPNAKINFKKDLAGKWRLCKINPSFEK